MKQCSKCKEAKLLSEFNVRPDRPSGYRSECKSCQYKSQHRNRKREPKIYRAYNRLHYAKKIGRIIPPMFCERCGQAKPLQAHHPDYTKPFKVKWLCQICHNIANKEVA